MFGCNCPVQHARNPGPGGNQIETTISQLHGKASKLWLLTSCGYDPLPHSKSRRIQSIGFVLKRQAVEADAIQMFQQDWWGLCRYALPRFSDVAARPLSRRLRDAVASFDDLVGTRDKRRW
jgi:hypothetical protein